MIGIDTNLLVRLITRDDPVQAKKARDILEQQFTPENPAFVSLSCMLELDWVLRSGYGLANHQRAEALEGVLRLRTVRVQNEKEVYEAMLVLKSGQGSFADALIGALGLWAGCTATLTFDRKASRLPGFELIL